jgi:hypothetical protein
MDLRRDAIVFFLLLVLSEYSALPDSDFGLETDVYDSDDNDVDEEEDPAPLKCFVDGRCDNSQHVDGSLSANEIECLKSCKLNDDCGWFSYDYESKFCEAFANCSRLDTTSGHWISGEAECDLPQCWIQGECLGLTHDQKKVGSEEECLDLCKSDPACFWFTFFKAPTECVLYSNCPTLDNTCLDCVSGQRSCIVDTKPQPTGQI